MDDMNIGYARVSTEEQNLDLQVQALEAAGCARIFRDRGISGASRERPGLAKALTSAEEGDVLVVWKLDRLGRSLPHLVEVIDALRQIGIASAPYRSRSIPPAPAVGSISISWPRSPNSSAR